MHGKIQCFKDKTVRIYERLTCNKACISLSRAFVEHHLHYYFIFKYLQCSLLQDNRQIIFLSVLYSNLICTKIITMGLNPKISTVERISASMRQLYQTIIMRLDICFIKTTSHKSYFEIATLRKKIPPIHTGASTGISPFLDIGRRNK